MWDNASARLDVVDVTIGDDPLTTFTDDELVARFGPRPARLVAATYPSHLVSPVAPARYLTWLPALRRARHRSADVMGTIDTMPPTTSTPPSSRRRVDPSL